VAQENALSYSVSANGPVSLRIDALGGISKAAGGARAHAIGQIAALARRPRARVERADDRALDVGDEGRACACGNVGLVEDIVRAQATRHSIAGSLRSRRPIPTPRGSPRR
jgi:hypothetical protein